MLNPIKGSKFEMSSINTNSEGKEMMMTQQETRSMTVAEFMALPDDGNRHELVRGELLPGFSVPLNMFFVEE